MRRTGVTHTDVLTAMLLVVLIGSYAMAGVLVADDIEARVKCASHLRQIGQALLLYANENKGAYPRTIFDSKNPDPKPVWGTPYINNNKLGPAAEPVSPFAKDESPEAQYRPAPNDVTAAFYLLMRTQEITSEVFVCPATLREKWDFGGGPHHALHWTNWAGKNVLRDHVSYSYQNPYPSREAIASGFKLNHSISAEFAVAADMNPGTEALTKLRVRSSAADMRAGNTPNHSRDGQNILFGDGHVDFLQNPFVGVRRDNIYTYGPSGQNHPETGGSGIVGSPATADDSILLPTARDLGAADEKGDPVDSVQVRELNQNEAKQLREKLEGRYVRMEGNRRITLEITPDRIVAKSGPVTIDFDYELAGMLNERAVLKLSAEDTPPSSALLAPQKDGVKITGSQFFAGDWKRQ